ncbi:MAG TPA: peptide chain release factor N(5)-glutamine methyltransferase [Candidatus Paceibacterota bacterium]|nr:peptide chain release factor N(5)-glutamine methyltransferase [Candidatus Paceibacterota bacterium]
MNNTEYFKKAKAWLLREKYHGQETEKFFVDVSRLENGEPVDYVIGSRPFLDCNIDLSYRPLIPREETEFWVKNAISKIKEKTPQNQSINILDIFSGSGCIGIALLKHLPLAQVDFADFSTDAIQQIQNNLEKNKITKDRTEIFHSDVFKDIPPKHYDFIFANPPYIPEKNFESLDISVRDFEPTEALVGGEDGLFFIRKLIDAAPSFLTPGGKLFIEFDTEQKNQIKKILQKLPHFSYHFEKDQFGLFRTVQLSLQK